MQANALQKSYDTSPRVPWSTSTQTGISMHKPLKKKSFPQSVIDLWKGVSRVGEKREKHS